MRGIAIRELAPDDAAAFGALRRALWPDMDGAENEREVALILSGAGDAAAFVAFAPDGEALGFVEVSLRQVAEGCGPPPIGFIEGWYVAAGHRRRGVGRRLVAAAEDWARAGGCREMASDGKLANATGHSAHRALGYAEVSRNIHYRKAL